jgi:hypothetical protein
MSTSASMRRRFLCEGISHQSENLSDLEIPALLPGKSDGHPTEHRPVDADEQSKTWAGHPILCPFLMIAIVSWPASVRPTLQESSEPTLGQMSHFTVSVHFVCGPGQ